METSPVPRSQPMMTFLDAVKQCLRKYGDFGGRATRAEFWWWQVFAWIGGLIFGVVDSSISSFSSSEFFFSPFGAILGLATLLPGLAVQARRLHDIGRTGWWILLWWTIYILGLTPLIVGGIFSFFYMWSAVSDAGWGNIISAYVPLVIGGLITLVAVVAVTIWWIVWLARQGETGPNRYGPDPRAWDEPGLAPSSWASPARP